MLKHLHVWIGLEIQDLHFVQGRSYDCDPSTKGFALDSTVFDEKSTRKDVYVPDGNYFYLPENNTHPRKLKAKIQEILSYADERVVNFTTHSNVPINLIGEMISDGLISYDAITIHVMKDDNSDIEYESTFDAEGYLVNFRAGELSW